MEAAGYQQQPTLLAPLLSLANPQQPFEPNNGGGSSGGDWTTVLCDLRRSVSNLVLYVLESMPVPWLLTSATTTSAPPPMLPPTPAPATAPSATVTQPPYQLQEVDELDDGGKRARRFNWPDPMTQSLPLHPPPPPPLWPLARPCVQVCGGTVLRCLTEHSDQIKSEACQKEVFYFEKMEVSDFRNDVILAAACRTDVEKFCKDILGLDGAAGAFDRAKLNVDGGAIALGHPVGASGNRITLHLVNAMKRLGKKRGIATQCVGGGLGGAVLIEMV